jgi:hypothetical protein
MTAVAGEAGSDVINDHVGFFAPSLICASDAGMENFSARPDLTALDFRGSACREARMHASISAAAGSTERLFRAARRFREEFFTTKTR